jgi:hypothetical protein
MQIIKSIISSNLFYTLISVFFTAYLTYYFTKKSKYNLNNSDLYILQLEKIYLPLHIQIHNKEFEQINIYALHNLLIQKKKKYYLYIPNKLLTLTDILTKQIQNKQIKKETVLQIKDYIEYEFVLSKKNWGCLI